jgi:hypothetical protein
MVAIKPGAVVYVEGVAYQGGQVVEVPANEAKALTGQGVVAKPD